MPGLVPGIHVYNAYKRKGVDGRDKPGHDDGTAFCMELDFHPDFALHASQSWLDDAITMVP
jgi:hypothetical protein